MQRPKTEHLSESALSQPDSFVEAATTSVVALGSPSNIVILPGGTTNFHVSAQGLPAPAYQWLFNGTSLAGATSSLLSLTNVQASQAGNYRVIVTNAGGSATSAVATLSVLVSPAVRVAALQTNGVSLALDSAAGLTYTLQYKNYLTDSNWTSLLPSISGNGGQVFIRDTNPPTSPSRFYRVSVR